MIGSNPLYNEHNKAVVNATGNIFQGTVTASDPGSFCVQVAPHGQDHQSLVQGIPLSSCMSHLLGFKESSLPPVGATVLCYKSATNQCIIFGVTAKPDDLGESGMFPTRSILGAGDGIADAQNTVGYAGKGVSHLHTVNNNRPTDIVEGEYAISNDFGVLLGLFQQMATLKASSLAQIQMFVLDDLVRIVSHNFQHFTALGELRVFHDGKGLHLEAGMTHEPKEAMAGVPQVTSELPTGSLTHTGKATTNDKDNFYNIKDENLQAIQRLKILVGKLGDFVNIMLVRPAEGFESVRSQNGETQEYIDTGLFDFKLLGDGTCLVRSAKGISLQKTNWIRVPNRVRSPEDPEGDDAATMDYPEKEAFAFDDQYKYEGQPFLYFLQIRDYLAYMHEEYALKNIKAHKKDFSINDDFTKEKDLKDIKKVDPLSGTTYLKKTASITLMPNGGISLIDAWGSALVLEGGNILIQPAKDLIVQPMRNMVSKVGGNFSLQAKNEIDISSTQGGLRVKTEQVQYFFSQNSGLVLEAGGEAASDFFPQDEAVQGVAGVIIKATNSGVFQFSNYSYNRTKTRHISYSGEHFIKADKNITNSAKDRIDIQTDTTITIGAQTILGIADGSLILTGVQNTIIGLKNQTFGVCPIGPVQGILEEDGIKDIREYNDKIAALKVQDYSSNFRKDEDFEDLKFRFLSTDKYGLIQEQDVIPQTVTQVEDALFKLHGLVEWKETEVNETYPYPGKDAEFWYIGGVMNNLEKTKNELHNKATENSATGSYSEGGSLFKNYKVKA